MLTFKEFVKRYLVSVEVLTVNYPIESIEMDTTIESLQSALEDRLMCYGEMEVISGDVEGFYCKYCDKDLSCFSDHGVALHMKKCYYDYIATFK